MSVPAAQHNREIHENIKAWEKKPALREVYREFHRLIARSLIDCPGAVTLELGSGIGKIKETIPHCVTSDIFPNPWLDRTENAYALSYGDGAVANLILFDVWHHLQYPGTALRECRRVLRPGGRLLIFDPGMGLAGRLVYGMFHHEPLGFGQPLSWEAPAGWNPHQAPYFAAQASAHRFFVRRERTEWEADWSLVRLCRLSGLAYVGSGGFRGPRLYPSALCPALRAIDRGLSALPGIFASRLLVVLERPPGAREG